MVQQGSNSQKPARDIIVRHRRHDYREGRHATLLTHDDSLQIMAELKKSGSRMPGMVQEIAADVIAGNPPHLEQVPGLPGTYVVSSNELRGIIARAVIDGFAQATYNTAQSHDGLPHTRKIAEDTNSEAH